MQTDHEKEGLFGKIKIIKLEEFNAEDKFGEIVQTVRKSVIIIKYNDFGNRTESTTYGEDGNLEVRCVFKYNVESDLTEIARYDAVGLLYHQTLYEYDDDHRMVRENIFFEGKLDQYTKNNYDLTRNLIECRHFSAEEKLVYKFEYKYNDKGKVIKLILTTFDGAEGDESSTDYQYNDKDELILEHSSEYKNAYEYDSNGIVLRTMDECLFEGEMLLMLDHTFKYEYDDSRNWIKKITLEKEFIPQVIEIRSITYY